MIAIRQNNRNKTTHVSYHIIVLLIRFYFVPGINLLQLGMVSTYIILHLLGDLLRLNHIIVLEKNYWARVTYPWWQIQQFGKVKGQISSESFINTRDRKKVNDYRFDV